MGRFAFIRRYTRTALRGTKLETSENNTGMERLVCQKDNSEWMPITVTRTCNTSRSTHFPAFKSLAKFTASHNRPQMTRNWKYFKQTTRTLTSEKSHTFGNYISITANVSNNYFSPQAEIFTVSGSFDCFLFLFSARRQLFCGLLGKVPPGMTIFSRSVNLSTRFS